MKNNSTKMEKPIFCLRVSKCYKEILPELLEGVEKHREKNEQHESKMKSQRSKMKTSVKQDEKVRRKRESVRSTKNNGK